MASASGTPFMALPQPPGASDTSLALSSLPSSSTPQTFGGYTQDDVAMGQPIATIQALSIQSSMVASIPEQDTPERNALRAENEGLRRYAEWQYVEGNKQIHQIKEQAVFHHEQYEKIDQSTKQHAPNIKELLTRRINWNSMKPRLANPLCEPRLLQKLQRPVFNFHRCLQS